MPFFIYGNDAKTGVVAKRVYSDAATEDQARAYADSLGMAVTTLVPCRADQKPIEPSAAAARWPRISANSDWASG